MEHAINTTDNCSKSNRITRLLDTITQVNEKLETMNQRMEKLEILLAQQQRATTKEYMKNSTAVCDDYPIYFFPPLAPEHPLTQDLPQTKGALFRMSADVLLLKRHTE